jgi:CHAT domain-containing protein/Tfp pilus assembly protein PilF
MKWRTNLMRLNHVRTASILLLLSQFISIDFAQTRPSDLGPPVVKLEVGKPIDGALKGGESKTFIVPLREGEFLDVVVEQRGIDVAVTLVAPGGQALSHVDSPNGANGPEPISFIADKGGDYMLLVESFEKDAPAGQYQIKVETLRGSTANDRDLVAGRSKYFEALDTEQRRDEASVRTAITLYEAATTLLHRGNDLELEAESFNNIGLLYHELGESVKSFPYLARSLSLNRQVGRQRGEAETLINIGAAYDNLSEPQKSLNYYTQALKVLNGDHPDLEAAAVSNIGKIYTNLGEYPKAIENLQRSLELTQKNGPRPNQLYPLANLAATYSAMGEKQRAIETYQKALDIVPELKQPRVEAMLLSNMGHIYSDLKDNQRALDILTMALELRRKAGDRNGEVFTLHNLGVIYDEMGQREKGKDFLKQAMQLSRSNGDKLSEANNLYSLAAFEREENNLIGAKENLESALANLESFRSKLANMESRTSVFAAMHKYYEAYISVLMDLHKQNPQVGYDERALEVSERARARALLEILTEAGIDVRHGVDRKLLEQERKLQDALNERAGRQARIANNKNAPDENTKLAKEIAALNSEFNDVQSQIRLNSERYGSLVEPAPLTLAQIQRDVLDADTVLLEYSLGDKKSFLWVVTASSINSYELPKRAEVELMARRTYGLLNDGKGWVQKNDIRAGYMDAAEPLSKTLVAPAEAKIKGKRLVIVSDGALQYVPFGALPHPSDRSISGKRFLAETNEITSISSISALSVLRRETAGRTKAAKSLAVFADPVFSASDERVGAVRRIPANSAVEPVVLRTRTMLERALNIESVEDAAPAIPRLPFTRREADRILATVPVNSRLKATDFTASRATVATKDLLSYRIVHFATHGILHTEHPDLSGIVLSLVNEKGEPVNGFLRLNEIYDMKLNADLVVLSACQTALGKEVRGEGLIGLTRGFMYAGSPRVVASLWKVDDVATAELMKIFYQKMLKEKMRPAAALREAKIAMMKQKRWNSPYYWAAFELQGEWR